MSNDVGIIYWVTIFNCFLSFLYKIWMNLLWTSKTNWYSTNLVSNFWNILSVVGTTVWFHADMNVCMYIYLYVCINFFFNKAFLSMLIYRSEIESENSISRFSLRPVETLCSYKFSFLCCIWYIYEYRLVGICLLMNSRMNIKCFLKLIIFI